MEGLEAKSTKLLPVGDVAVSTCEILTHQLTAAWPAVKQGQVTN